MEGVLVTAKKDGAHISTTVVSDEKGHYVFPAGRLEPGHYTIKIRATGYFADGRPAADIVKGKTTTTDIALNKTDNIAPQLTSRGLDDLHARHRQPEGLPSGLHQLPHAAAHRHQRPHRGGFPADHSAHGHLGAGVAAAAAAEAAARPARQSRQSRSDAHQGRRRLSRQRRPLHDRDLEISACRPCRTAPHRAAANAVNVIITSY